jgi:hypothetical protein
MANNEIERDNYVVIDDAEDGDDQNRGMCAKLMLLLCVMISAALTIFAFWEASFWFDQRTEICINPMETQTIGLAYMITMLMFGYFTKEFVKLLIKQ